MNIGNVAAMSNNCYNAIKSNDNGNVSDFIIPQVDEQQSKSCTVESDNVVDPINTMEAMTGKVTAKGSSYSVTDEDIEYFREKYGEKYNEDTAYELYYELADKEIISINDAARSSGTSVAMPLSAFKSITYFGGGDPYGLGKNLNRDIGFVSDRVYIKDVSRTDKDSPYKVLWDSFKKSYDRKTDTWEDALQETIDFERYVKENKSTADHVFRQHREQVIEGLEKTKDVIMQIFGDKNL